MERVRTNQIEYPIAGRDNTAVFDYLTQKDVLMRKL